MPYLSNRRPFPQAPNRVPLNNSSCTDVYNGNEGPAFLCRFRLPLSPSAPSVSAVPFVQAFELSNDADSERKNDLYHVSPRADLWSHLIAEQHEDLVVVVVDSPHHPSFRSDTCCSDSTTYVSETQIPGDVLLSSPTRTECRPQAASTAKLSCGRCCSLHTVCTIARSVIATLRSEVANSPFYRGG